MAPMKLSKIISLKYSLIKGLVRYIGLGVCNWLGRKH